MAIDCRDRDAIVVCMLVGNTSVMPRAIVGESGASRRKSGRSCFAEAWGVLVLEGEAVASRAVDGAFDWDACLAGTFVVRPFQGVITALAMEGQRSVVAAAMLWTPEICTLAVIFAQSR